MLLYGGIASGKGFVCWLSVLSMASLPLRHDRPLVNGAPCLSEPGHDRPSGGRTPDLRGRRGLGGEWMPPPDGSECFTRRSRHLLLCRPCCQLLLFIQGRSPNAIKNHWHSVVKKKPLPHELVAVSIRRYPQGTFHQGLKKTHVMMLPCRHMSFMVL